MHNAHQKPAPIPYRVLLETVFAATREDDVFALVQPGEAAGFEQKALDVHRLKHKRDIVRDSGPNLGLGQRIDRLHGGSLRTYLRFGSALHLSGQPLSA